MSIALHPHHIVETDDRRILGAFRFEDSVTRLPVILPLLPEARRATLVGHPGGDDLILPKHSVQVRMNRSGVYVIFRAPFFEKYTGAFKDPSPPDEVQNEPLQLCFSLRDAGSSYLPQEFLFRLPRNTNPEVPDSVFIPQRVGLLRSPGATVQSGWTILRICVTQTVSSNPLPGVLIRVFASPRQPNDAPIGEGMTDWRDNALGEALVPLSNILRFQPGTEDTVVEVEQTIEFDAVRDGNFTGADDRLPNVSILRAGTSLNLIRPPHYPQDSSLDVLQPQTPVRVRAGQEYVVHLAMP